MDSRVKVVIIIIVAIAIYPRLFFGWPDLRQIFRLQFIWLEGIYRVLYL